MARLSLEDTETKLSEAQVLNNQQRNKIETMTSDTEEFKSKIISADNSIFNLENELQTTKERLASTEENEKELGAKGKLLSEQLQNANDKST